MSTHDPQRTARIVLIAVLLGAGAAAAGIHEWTLLGPRIADVRDLVIDPEDPSIVYGRTPDGLLKTVDGGTSWTLIEEAGEISLRHSDVLAISSRPPSVLYAVADRWASVDRCRIVKSEDRGVTWTPTGLQDCDVTDLAVDPWNPAVVYATAGTREVPPCGPGGCDWAPGWVYKSVDGGASWTAVPLGHNRTLAIDPIHPSTLYVGTSNGVWKSVDGGASWIEARAGLPEGRISELAIDPRDPSILYAATVYSGVFKSIDGGESWWTSNEAARLATADALVIDPDDPDVIYAGTRGAGIYKSSDGGLGWAPVWAEAGGRQVRALAVHPLDTSVVDAGTLGAGVIKSGNRGVTWRTLAAPARTDADVLAVAIGQRFATTFYAGTRNAGVYRSADEGRTWRAVNRGLEAGRITALAIAPSHPSIVYAGTRGHGTWRSGNDGDSWHLARYGTDDAEVFSLVVDPERPNRVYACTDRGLYVLRGGGESYGDRYFSDPVYDFAIDSRASTFYAATSDGLYQGTVGRFRIDWTPIEGGLPDGAVRSVAVDPRRPGVLYAGTSEGLYKSTDAGLSWFFAGPRDRWGPVDHLVQLVVDPRASSRVFARDSYLYESVDGGVSWSPVEPRYGGGDLVLHPWSPSTLYRLGSRRFVELTRPRCDNTGLCVDHDRFAVEVVWRDGRGRSGVARATPAVSRDAGVLWFFAEANWEMLVKVLDGCAINDRFWVFAAATTDVEYGLRVTDTATGAVKTWFNPRGNAAAAVTDTAAFATCDAGDGSTAAPPALARQVLGPAVAPQRLAAQDAARTGTCRPSPTRLCLQDERYRIEVSWRDVAGRRGSGRGVSIGSDDSGLLWFFSPDNWEMLVKVLDGCEINNRFWVFSAATTDVEYTLRVTDTATGLVRSYSNPLGTAAAAITDTNAFATCDG